MPKVRTTNDSKSVTVGGNRRRRRKSPLSKAEQKEVARIAESTIVKMDNKRQHYGLSTALSAPTPAGTNPFSLIGGLAQGLSDDEFTGNQIDVQGIGLRFSLRGNTSAGPSSTLMRVLVFQSSTPYGGPLQGGAPANVLQQNHPLSWYDTDSVGKNIKILHDSRHIMANRDQNSDYEQYLDVYIDGKKVDNPGWDDVAAAWNANDIYYAVCSEVGVQMPTYNVSSVVRFRCQ